MHHLRNSCLKRKTKLVFIASELLKSFPDLDLRLNLSATNKCLRYKIPSISEKVFELPFDDQNTQHTLHEAILSIKEIARLFDA